MSGPTEVEAGNLLTPEEEARALRMDLAVQHARYVELKAVAAVLLLCLSAVVVTFVLIVSHPTPPAVVSAPMQSTTTQGGNPR